ncbi:EmrB/QacA subfamily drug resistance transporter [Herbihabitans rhizosphaerae]|uniref:EmrB/QacA subfamily drug resistance transporter n=1 Tax=Herbihabitans rhizosphaerae TaxID=1872711 RepID=A0A4Q7KJR9_9PSEU|nr:MFS transporter [Herbihabitans rhizosphaerae]RZS36436.1 EmrB/QacA subfamily drug resistance transporter [Herbihabitans rhizosphaerae]
MSENDPRRWRALALLCVVNFMVILDAQIVIVALPTIEHGLGFTASGAQWVMSAYLLSFGGLLLLGGRAGDLLGRRRVFLWGTTLFGIASLLCGLAWTPEILVLARVAHGVSAAMMAPTALAIVMTTFDEGAERNKALAAWGGSGGLGATAALVIGGVFTKVLGWESIFLLNVPVAAVLLALGVRLLPESGVRETVRRFDPVGAVTLTGALVLLTYAVVEAPVAGWLSVRTIGLLLGAVVLGVIFWLTESRSAAPLVPLRVFRSRSLVCGNLVMLLFGMAAWGMSTVVSRYAQTVLGYTPLEFGLGTVVMTLMTLVGSFGAQALVTRIGFRPVAAAAIALAGVGCLALYGLSVDGGYFTHLFAGLLVFGIALGGGTVAASVAALAGVGEREAGVASGTNTAAFQIGGALGAAVVTTVVVSRADLVDGFNAGLIACVVFAGIGVAVALCLPRAVRSTVEPSGV